MRGMQRLRRRLNRRRLLSMGFRSIGPGSFVHPGAKIHGAKYIDVGSGVYIGEGARVEAVDTHPYTRSSLGSSPHIRIGDRVMLTGGCHVGCIGEVIIEDDVGIAGGALVTDHGYGLVDGEIPLKLQPLVFQGPVVIEHGCIVSEHAAVMGGVRIGFNTLVGANAVVTRDLPPTCIAAGVPARVIRRFSLEEGRWLSGAEG
jgi:acetyltransferase-like isoleucine patch superfamily enzyme